MPVLFTLKIPTGLREFIFSIQSVFDLKGGKRHFHLKFC